MHHKSFTRIDGLLLGGALLVLVSSFLAWLDIRLDQGDLVRRASANAYDFTYTGIIPVVLIVVIGAITALLAIGRLPRPSAPWPLAVMLAAAVSTVLLLVRLVVNPYERRSDLEALGGSIDRGMGMTLATAGSLVVLVGAVLALAASRRRPATAPVTTTSVDDAHRRFMADATPAQGFPPPSQWESPTS